MPLSPEIQDFMDTPPAVDLQPVLETLALYHRALTEEQARALLDLATAHLPDTLQYGANFDFTEEITAQIQAVRAMRRSVLSESGRMAEGVSARELKEVVSASSTLLQTLLKTHEKVMNFSRQHAIEKAVTSVVRTLDGPDQASFFMALETELALID